MIVLNGKYSFAKVMLPNETHQVLEDDLALGQPYIVEKYKYLDDNTKEQIETFLNHPAFRRTNPVIMPDTHYGKGSCVGFTMKLGNYIIPNIIGVDIGCGILTAKLPIKYSDGMDLDVLDEYIRKNIPVGFNIHNNVPEINQIFREKILAVCVSLGLDINKVLRSIGTLGGGNHFIELGKDEEDCLWLTIHSGSRNLGLQVANFYQKRADELCASYFQNFGDLNFIPNTDNLSQDYLNAMMVAQRFAHENRMYMMSIIVNGFFNTEPIEIIDSVHNFIDFEDNIVRKGATPARLGQKVVIPFNMRDGLIIGEGLGNEEWNNSAPHGAGRILSRNKAKEILDLKLARDEMKTAGIYTTSVNENTLDEVAGAYKDKQLILDMIKDTVKVTNFVKPIYNLKDDTKKEKRR